jgi:hypothetical protein
MTHFVRIWFYRGSVQGIEDFPASERVDIFRGLGINGRPLSGALTHSDKGLSADAGSY